MKEKKKKTKYDTNPLDTDYARRADDGWGEPRPVEPLPKKEERWDAEAPTKRYDASIPVSYPSINVPPSYPPKIAEADVKHSPAVTPPSSTRIVPGLGLPEKYTLALPYAPFFIGAVAGVLELFLTPRSEPRARFHAAQGLALQLAAIAIKLIFNIVENITNTSAGGKIFWAVSTVLFIIATIRAWKGETVHVAAVDDATAWLNERIDPHKLKNHEKPNHK
jgi:uncharacterized membrane protein